MRHLPSLQTLQAFESAGRLQSYTRAAQELGVTHSAISHRIRELEAVSKETLFQRTGNQMLPTEAGHRLLAQVRAALGILEAAFPNAQLRHDAGGDRHKLVLSVLPAFAMRWMVPRLGAFRTTHPGVDLELRMTAELTDPSNGEIDAAIRYGPGEWPGVRVTHLADELLFPVTSPEYRDRLDIRQPSDLARCTLLRHTRQTWSPWFQAAGLATKEPTTGTSFSDAGLLLQAAAVGEGVALARGFLAMDDLGAGRLVGLFNRHVADRYAYFLVTRSTSKMSPALVLFESWLARMMAIDAKAIAGSFNT